VKNNKGDLGYFKWGQKPIQFQEACWDLNVGEFSDIVETSQGFNIIRLDDKKKNEEYIPDKNRETIFRTKQTLYSAVADSGKKLWDKTYKNIQKEKSYRYHSAAIKEATKIMSEKVEKNKIGMEFFTQAELNTTFAEWIDGEITLETILNRYEDNISRVIGALKKEKNLENEVRNLSMINLALVKAKEMNLDEEEDVARTLNNFLEDRLVYLVEKNEINNKVNYTEEEVKKYYEDNPDQFMKPAQMEMWDIVVDNKDEAVKIESQVRKGKDFETLAKKYSTDKFYKKKGGYLGFRTINARSSISRKAFEIGPNGKISEPIKYRDKWAIVKTGKLREKKLRPFHEVKRMAEGRLRNNKMAERRNEWSEELKNRYPIEIYEDKLTNL
jgi:parvulin-like peptidyl-prolyl isomerase